MIRVAYGSTLIYWQGQGFYLARTTAGGVCWEKQAAYCNGAVWADEAADLRVAAIPA